LRFFDANTFIGRPARPPVAGAPVASGVTAAGLLAAMDRAGIERALVWHAAQLDLGAATGNALLAEAIRPHERLVGCWALLPPQTGEQGEPADWLRRAAGARVRAVRAFPEAHRYLLRGEVFAEVLEAITAARVPLLLSLTRGVRWAEVYDLLAGFPELTVILCDAGCWGQDRLFRPLLQRYPNVHLEISAYLLDGGIEDLVGWCGARQVLFGTNFPAAYQGGMMLALAHAEIDAADRDAIAGGNLSRLLEGVRL
jgi:predicted TIM-barrel fold metal-dependent hydrolase